MQREYREDLYLSGNTDRQVFKSVLNLKFFCCFLTHTSLFLVSSSFHVAGMGLYYKDTH